MTRHRKLTEWQKREHLYYLRKMQSEGIRIEIPEALEQHARSLEITIAPPPDSEVFERDSGGLSYWVYLRLVSNTRCMVEHVAITVPWDDQIVLEKLDQKYPVGMYGYTPVAWNDVLNSRIERGLKFARAGGVVEGLLLATGMSRFPEGYRTGQSVPFTLRLYDPYDTEVSKDGYLFVQRCERRAKKVYTRAEDLFGDSRSDSRITEHASAMMATPSGKGQRPTNELLQVTGRFNEGRESNAES